MGIIEQIREQLRNAAHTVTGLTKLALGTADNTKVDNLTKEARITACKNCPKFSAITRQCGICLCFMDIKAALLYDPVESEKKGTKTKTVCPLGNW
jgi:hypothetical protein